MPPVRPDLFEFEFDPRSIRNTRDRLQLSQVALADWLDLPVNTISRWETGATTPDAKALAALWSIARLRDVEPEFFKRRKDSEVSVRTQLIMLWDYPTGKLHWKSIFEDWHYLQRYAGIRFPKVTSIDGILYRRPSDDTIFDDVYEPLDLSIGNPPERLAKEGLKIDHDWLGLSDAILEGARAASSDNPQSTIAIVASDNPDRVPLIQELIDANVDVYVMPVSDGCPGELLGMVEDDHVVRWNEPFVVSECVDVIDEVNGGPISRSDFGNRCKDRLDKAEVYPQDVGFSRRNPYGSVLRWLEANGVVRVVPAQGKGNRVRIHRLRT